VAGESSLSETKRQRSLAKGLAAGLIAGLAATAAKSFAEKLFPPRVHGEQDPAEALAEVAVGHSLDSETRTKAGRAIHWGFGAAAGAAYGALAEFYPAATDKEGATFGLALMALTEETALPAMGLAATAEDQSLRERTSETSSHLVYGLVAERVRSFVRGLLG
jgi:putative membrane protein